MGYIDAIIGVENGAYDIRSIKRISVQKNNFDEVLNKVITATPEQTVPNTAQTVSNASQSVTPVTSPSSLTEIFKEASETYQVDENLLKAVAKAESDFNPNCVSSAGAIGVMQLMPQTATSLGVNNPYDAYENIMGGAKYLSKLLDKYNGDTSLALAAYNAGSGNVQKYGGIPPFKETQNYVTRVLGYAGTTINTDNTAYAAVSEEPFTIKSQPFQENPTSVIFAVASKDATDSTKRNL